MMKLNFLLYLVLIICACSVVTSQHKARDLFIALQGAQAQARQMDVEYGRLQLEQSTWAMHSRIEQIATRQLGMVRPDAKHTQIVVIPRGSAP